MDLYNNWGKKILKHQGSHLLQHGSFHLFAHYDQREWSFHRRGLYMTLAATRLQRMWKFLGLQLVWCWGLGVRTVKNGSRAAIDSSSRVSTTYSLGELIPATGYLQPIPLGIMHFPSQSSLFPLSEVSSEVFLDIPSQKRLNAPGTIVRLCQLI